MRPVSDRQAVIVVGAGLSGLATSLGVALHGRHVFVLEAADLVGGAAAYSGGQVWVAANHVARRQGIEDDLEWGERYVRGMAREQPEYLDERAMLRWLHTAPAAAEYWEDVGAVRWAVIPGLADYHTEIEGALEEGRYLTNEVIDGGALGAWRHRIRVSPYFPVGTTYSEMFVRGRRLAQVETQETDAWATEHAGVPAFGIAGRAESEATPPAGGTDPLTFGTGVVASFLARVLKEGAVQILTSHRVVELLREGDGPILGVRAEGPDGSREFRGPVVLATSTYDWSPELVKEFLGLDSEDFGSVAPETVRGDAITLVRAVGGGIAWIPATSVPILPGWRSQIGTGYGYGPEYALPHSMIVDRTGRRYCNDSYWVDIVARTLNPADRHLPFFLIWDDQHRQKYGLAGTPPGGTYPGSSGVISAATLPDLADRLGIVRDQLAATAETFSENARLGKDPDFGRGTVSVVNLFAGDPQHRPSPVLGPIEQPPFHGLRLIFVGTGIGSSGVHIDSEGHVLDRQGRAIPDLFAVGSCAALTTTGTGYNSGIALGRGLTLAYLVARELGGAPLE